MLRDSKRDELKSIAEIKRAQNKVCCVEGCESKVTKYKGPGQEDHCRKHQKNLHDYGGLAKREKTYSQSRESVCKCCGADAYENPLVLPYVKTDPVKANQLVRSVVTVDHIISKSQARAMGWTEEQINHPSNLQTLCKNCHGIKSAIEEDFLTGEKKLEKLQEKG